MVVYFFIGLTIKKLIMVENLKKEKEKFCIINSKWALIHTEADAVNEDLHSKNEIQEQGNRYDMEMRYTDENEVNKNYEQILKNDIFDEFKKLFKTLIKKMKVLINY